MQHCTITKSSHPVGFQRPKTIASYRIHRRLASAFGTRRCVVAYITRRGERSRPTGRSLAVRGRAAFARSSFLKGCYVWCHKAEGVVAVTLCVESSFHFAED